MFYCRLIALLASILLMTACSFVAMVPQQALAPPRQNYPVDSSQTVEDCLHQLKAPAAAAVEALDGELIRVANWNVHKGADSDWAEDLRALSRGRDLVFLQEAPITASELASVKERFWSFAPGYRQGELDTGVMTVSGVRPLVHCGLTAWEPWLGTPKATGVAQYALAGREDTLMVINLHGVNFSLGVEAYRGQLKAVETLARQHRGPLIVAGDFNSWSDRRDQLLEDFSVAVAARPVRFQRDLRKRFIDHPLDHILVRGLSVERSDSLATTSSDHNPMVATLRVESL